jgi:ketosteroid isomerase-like protein
VIAEPGNRPQACDAELLGRAYMAALNERVPEPLLELLDPEIEFVPTGLSRDRRKYVGHAGVREWLETARARGNQHAGRVVEVRKIGPDRWALLGEVWHGEQLVAPLAVMIRLRGGLIVESVSYLSDADLLVELGLLGERPSEQGAR